MLFAVGAEVHGEVGGVRGGDDGSDGGFWPGTFIISLFIDGDDV